VPAPELHLDAKGQPDHHRVRSRWGSKGRINLIGTLAIEGCAKQLEYRMMEGSCRSVEVASYLNALAEQAHTEGKPCVVVLDNASFHTARMVREREGEWQEKGLVLYRLPAYCPPLKNLIEAVWRRLKGFLMPRRFYDSVAELREAVLRALHLLGAVEIQCLLGGT
jgi:putative transposase